MIRKIILSILFLFFTASHFAQETRVLISEKKAGKRVVLMAENTTQDTLNVFLMVLSEGYRRSASRPIIKNIPPRTKVPMITLIELTSETSSYTYDLIVNDREYDLNVSIKKDVIDISQLLDGKIVIFTIDDCNKCALLTNTLNEKKIGHRLFNIYEDPELYEQFNTFIKKEAPETRRIKFPVVWNRSYTVFGFEKLETIISELQQ